jgi:predicted RNase H-like HicB family nuclease
MDPDDIVWALTQLKKHQEFHQPLFQCQCGTYLVSYPSIPGWVVTAEQTEEHFGMAKEIKTLGIASCPACVKPRN